MVIDGGKRAVATIAESIERRSIIRLFLPLLSAFGELFRSDTDRLLRRGITAVGCEIDQRFDDLFVACTDVQGGVDVHAQRSFRRRGTDGCQSRAGGELTSLQIDSFAREHLTIGMLDDHAPQVRRDVVKTADHGIA
jgi:hypothetical protein